MCNGKNATLFNNNRFDFWPTFFKLHGRSLLSLSIGELAASPMDHYVLWLEHNVCLYNSHYAGIYTHFLYVSGGNKCKCPFNKSREHENTSWLWLPISFFLYRTTQAIMPIYTDFLEETFCPIILLYTLVKYRVLSKYIHTYIHADKRHSSLGEPTFLTYL